MFAPGSDRMMVGHYIQDAIYTIKPTGTGVHWYSVSFSLHTTLSLEIDVLRTEMGNI